MPAKISSSKEEKKSDNNKLRAKLREILTRKKRPFSNLDEEVGYKMSRLIRTIKHSTQADNLLTADYNGRLAVYSSNDQIFDYITVIIAMNTSNPSALKTSEKKFFLKLITGIVEQHNSVVRETKPIDEWEPEDWLSSSRKITEIQMKLKSCQLGKFITELLKEEIYEQVYFADTIFLCGISYLFGGNSLVQKDLIEKIGTGTENRVMRNIEALISKLGKFILKNIDESGFV